ncbi:MAG: hypothetical protein AAGK69_10650, partial [Pseudomonadota bacterium]
LHPCRAPSIGSTRTGCRSDGRPVIGPGFGGAEGLQSRLVIRASVVIPDEVFLHTWSNRLCNLLESLGTDARRVWASKFAGLPVAPSPRCG